MTAQREISFTATAAMVLNDSKSGPVNLVAGDSVRIDMDVVVA